jgi:hypothetical protein
MRSMSKTFGTYGHQHRLHDHKLPANCDARLYTLLEAAMLLLKERGSIKIYRP